MSDRIEKTVEINAPLSRVWRALTDYREFGNWFRVKLEGPFIVGEVARGHITHPGYEHIRMEAVIQRIEPMRLFSFTWHPMPSILPSTIRANRRLSSSSHSRRSLPAQGSVSSSRASTRYRPIVAPKPSA
jgi:uncharacterized protein YndB with AHSA1/START domain